MYIGLIIIYIAHWLPDWEVGFSWEIWYGTASATGIKCDNDYIIISLAMRNFRNTLRFIGIEQIKSEIILGQKSSSFVEARMDQINFWWDLDWASKLMSITSVGLLESMLWSWSQHNVASSKFEQSRSWRRLNWIRRKWSRKKVWW